jgi:hypothetical protein
MGMEIKMKTTLLSSALLLSVAATSALAAPKWDQVTATYSSFEVGVVDFGGFGVSGTKLITPNLFIAGGLATTSEDDTVLDTTFNELSLGLGYRHALNNTTDVYGVISFEDLEAETDFGSDSENGYGLKAGIRSMVTPKVELAGEIAYVDIEDIDDVTFSISGEYFFTNQFSAGIGYSSGLNVLSEFFEEDLDTLTLSASYSF